MKNKNIYIIILLICYLYYKNNFKIEGMANTVIEFFDEIPSVSFPFKNLYDDKGNKIPIITINAPFRSETHRNLYNKYKKDGYYFLGCSSYLEFPGKIDNPYDDPYYKNHNDNYEKMVRAWIHCFRNPEKYIKTGIPKALISESDFIDYDNSDPIPIQEKKYDFIYVCLDEGPRHDSISCNPGWQAYNRNWELAKKCFKVMCGKFELRGLIVGRTNCDITDKCINKMEFVPYQPQDKFLKLVQQCKFIFVPNVHDASPRVITHALCYNMPILVNVNIIGGWKYVNNETGVFFRDEKDISIALSQLLHHFNTYNPRQWYYKNYGNKNSGKKLLQFLKKYYPEVDFTGMKYVKF